MITTTVFHHPDDADTVSVNTKLRYNGEKYATIDFGGVTIFPTEKNLADLIAALKAHAEANAAADEAAAATEAANYHGVVQLAEVA